MRSISRVPERPPLTAASLRKWFSLLLLLPLSACAAQQTPIASKGTNAANASQTPALRRWLAMNPAQFARLPEAQQAVSFNHIDRELMAAAILHATNREREKNGLPSLAYHPLAGEAAALQARLMAEHHFVGHVNASGNLRTPLDRMRHVGGDPRYIAENVAMEFVRRYKGGSPFYSRVENGQTIFSSTPDGPAIPMHSYASFADFVVEGWMGSPGHRANILKKEPQFLGCAAAPAREQAGLEALYCAQVFFTPQPETSDGQGH